MAALLPTGNAGSNTAADHIETAQLPEALGLGRQTLIRTDSGSSIHACRLGYERRDIKIAEPYREPGRGVLPDGTALAVTSATVPRSASWHRSSREPTPEERIRWAGHPVPPPPPPKPMPVGPNMETARPRIEEHQGEVFYTKTGKPFIYRTNLYTLVIVESRRNVQWHQIRSALEAWPIAGPSEIPRCPERSGRYVYGIVSDERIRQEGW
ncbi:hypothetical protein STENM327S_02369 [Streptomyces tendae]